MITETAVISSTDQVLRQIEKAAEKDFLPIVEPYKGKILGAPLSLRITLESSLTK